jgi:predicted glutamine amidotransferase
VETTNGDGFGFGWYATAPAPGLFLSTEPAGNDRNLRRELAAQITAGVVFAHVRASTGTAIQQTNCHPSRLTSSRNRPWRQPVSRPRRTSHRH